MNAVGLGNDADPTALRFRSAQDASDYATHVLQDSKKRLAEQNLGAFDRYVKGEVAAYVGLDFGLHDGQYQLFFVAVPIPSLDAEPSGNRWNKNAMFLGITELVHGPKDITIPSFVWLETFEQRNDFRRDILANLSAVNIVIKTGQIVSERETSSFGVGFPASESAGVSALIQHGTEIANGVKNDTWEHLREVAHKPNFVEFLGRIRLLIDNVGPWLVFHESFDGCIKVVDVMLCTLPGQPCK